MLWDDPVVLQGFGVLLRRLWPSDLDSLFALYDEDTARYILGWNRTETADEFRLQYGSLATERNEYFAVEFQGEVVGTTSYRNFFPAHRRIEIGATWYGASAKGTVVIQACKYLMLEYAFESLGINRVEFMVDARNARSRAAVSKLGAVQEGIFRRHIVCLDGFVRDTVAFSILRSDWPAVRESLEARISQAAASPNR